MSNFDDRSYDENPYAVGNFTDDDYESQVPVHVPDYFVLSIISVFFCLPFGIPAIFYAAKAKSFRDTGNYHLALEFSGKAKLFTFLALILGILPLIAQIVLFIAA